MPRRKRWRSISCGAIPATGRGNSNWRGPKPCWATGKALDALEAAINEGLPDAAHALDDPAFAALAGDRRLTALREKATPRPVARGATLNAGSGADAVAIHEDAGGTHIQAGDVKLDTDY
jgi:hypothetical protein